jgi:hypothetical protein
LESKFQFQIPNSKFIVGIEGKAPLANPTMKAICQYADLGAMEMGFDTLTKEMVAAIKVTSISSCQ